MKRLWFVLVALAALGSGAAAETAAWQLPDGSVRLNGLFRLALVTDPAADCTAGIPDGAAPAEGWKGASLPAAPTPDTRYVFEADFSVAGLGQGALPGLYLGAASYPFEVFLNGKLVYANGRSAPLYNSNTFSGESLLIPPALLAADGPNRLVIVAQPRGETSPLDDIVLCSHDEAVSRAFWKTFFETNLVQGAAACALMMGLYFFILMFTGHGADRRYLYFALLCLCFAFAYANMIFNYRSNDQLFWEKVSRVAFPFTVISLALFVAEFTDVIRRRRWLPLIIGVPAAAAAIAIIVQPDMGGVARTFGLIMNFLITPLLVGGLVLLVIDTIRRRRVESGLILAGYLVLIGASLWDIFYVNSGLLPYAYLVPYGFLVLLIAVFFILAFEQTALSRLASRQAAEISQRSARQDELLARIRAAARDLSEASDELSRTTAESRHIIEEYRSSNEAIAQTLFQRFQEVNDMLGSVTRQLDQSARALPSAVRDQTEAVGEVTSAIQEINERYGMVMGHAGETNEKARLLTGLARTGTDAIAASTGAIGRVADESKVLRDILTTIEDIAERTNILSINAAIEAARAGDAGRGFKVIAQEINQLAGQATASLGASGERMKQMESNITHSAKLSREVGQKLDGIIGETGASAAAIGAIVGLLDEQRRQSDDIGVQIKRLYESARGVLAMVEDDRKNAEGMGQAISSLQQALGEIGSVLDGQRERSERLTRGVLSLESACDRARATARGLLELSDSRN